MLQIVCYRKYPKTVIPSFKYSLLLYMKCMQFLTGNLQSFNKSSNAIFSSNYPTIHPSSRNRPPISTILRTIFHIMYLHVTDPSQRDSSSLTSPHYLLLSMTPFPSRSLWTARHRPLSSHCDPSNTSRPFFGYPINWPRFLSRTLWTNINICLFN